MGVAIYAPESGMQIPKAQALSKQDLPSLSMRGGDSAENLSKKSGLSEWPSISEALTEQANKKASGTGEYEESQG